jgi:hypothetical protein
MCVNHDSEFGSSRNMVKAESERRKLPPVDSPQTAVKMAIASKITITWDWAVYRV